MWEHLAGAGSSGSPLARPRSCADRACRYRTMLDRRLKLTTGPTALAPTASPQPAPTARLLPKRAASQGRLVIL